MQSGSRPHHTFTPKAPFLPTASTSNTPATLAANRSRAPEPAVSLLRVRVTRGPHARYWAGSPERWQLWSRARRVPGVYRDPPQTSDIGFGGTNIDSRTFLRDSFELLGELPDLQDRRGRSDSSPGLRREPRDLPPQTTSLRYADRKRGPFSGDTHDVVVDLEVEVWASVDNQCL